MDSLNLHVFGIKLNWLNQDRYGASISSQMKEPDTPDNTLFNSGVDSIESIILAHFCAGIDVSNPRYLEGIETAYLALVNNCEDFGQDALESDKEGVEDGFDLSSSTIFKDYLNKSIDAVILSANKSNVSPAGFLIDESMCDCGEIEVIDVVDIIDEFAHHFGDNNSPTYKYASNLLCKSLSNHFSK